MKKYYEILQINKNASQEVITKVYKMLAKKYHPDTNPDNKPESELKFKEITEAYEILSDKEARRKYDVELEDFEKSEYIEYTKFEQLQQYCDELENQLDMLKANLNRQANDIHGVYNRAQQNAYNQGYKKAYYDAYINNLKDKRHEIINEKTPREIEKDLLALGITIVVVLIVLKIIWSIPALKEYILSLFSLNSN